MPFAAGTRVAVSSQNSEHRGRLGTVEVAADDDEYELNHVRLDGHVVGHTVKLSDAELRGTTQPSPIDYGE